MKNVTKSSATSIAISTTPPSNTPLQAPVERYCFITAGSQVSLVVFVVAALA